MSDVPLNGGAQATRHVEASTHLSAPISAAFEYLDDQARLGGHMSKPSLMMGGGRMTYEFDDQLGKEVGSRIGMIGSAFGMKLSLEEVITERIPPRRKAWRTVGYPKLIVIGPYEMGFDLAPHLEGANLTVWIDYQLPERGLGRLLPSLAEGYARWCVKQMVQDAEHAFDTAKIAT